MDTIEDCEREDALQAFMEEVTQQAIDEFTFDCLRAYYLKNPSLAVDAFAIYDEASKAFDVSPSAGLVLFTTAIEVCLKVALLKPVVYGLVHNESMAGIVSDLVVRHNGWDRFRDLISRVVTQYGGIDFDNYRIPGHPVTIWQDIDRIQKARNKVMHQGRQADKEVAALAMEVACHVLGIFLSKILNSFSLSVAADGTIRPDQADWFNPNYPPSAPRSAG